MSGQTVATVGIVPGFSAGLAERQRNYFIVFFLNGITAARNICQHLHFLLAWVITRPPNARRIEALTLSLRVEVDVSAIFLDAELLRIHVQQLDHVRHQVRKGLVHLTK